MITNTKLHVGRVADQCYRNLLGLQKDIRANAEAHRGMALAQSPPFEKLRGFVVDAIVAYQTRLQWFQALNDNAAKFQLLTEELTRRGWAQADLLTPFGELKQVVQSMNAAAKANYADIVAMCDQVIAAVNPPESLWPE